eukprot:6460-Heterococcus_DN1.PRE.1
MQVKALIERLPKHSEAPATLADFCQALNGHNGMKPIQPALDMIAELQDVTCGKLWWESQSYHIAAVMRARGMYCVYTVLLLRNSSTVHIAVPKWLSHCKGMIVLGTLLLRLKALSYGPVDTLEALLRLGPVGVTVDDGNGGQKPLDVYEIMRDRSWDRPPTPPPPPEIAASHHAVVLRALTARIQSSKVLSTAPARTNSSTLCKLQSCNAGFSLHLMIACVVCILHCVTQQSTEPIADANGQGDSPATTVSDSATAAKDNDATTDENEEEDWFNMALATPSLTAFSNGKITPAVAEQLSQRSTATTAANTSATSAAASKADKSSGQLFSVLGAAAAA